MTELTPPSNARLYTTSTGTFWVDTSQISRSELQTLNAEAAKGTLETRDLVQILKDHPGALHLVPGSERNMPPPDNTPHKPPNFTKSDEVSIDTLVAKLVYEQSKQMREARKEAQKAEQVEVVVKRKLSQDTLDTSLAAAESRCKAGIAQGAAQIASGAVQIGFQGGSMYALNKSRKVGNKEGAQIKESGSLKTAQSKRIETHEKQQGQLVKAHDNAKVKHDDAKAMETRTEMELQGLKQERVNKQKLRADEEETVGPTGAPTTRDKEIAGLDAKISFRENKKIDLRSEANKNARLMQEVKAKHGKNEAEHASFMRTSKNDIETSDQKIGRYHDKSDRCTTFARTLSAIGAPIGNTFEGGVRIWTSQLTFQAEVAEAQSNFLKAKADASDLRGHNFADWGGNLKESQNGLNQTLNTVTTGTQQQLNNTTGHF